MTDRITPEQRSENMAAVHSRGNVTTELALVKLFRAARITGWRRHKKIFGIRPDFIFSKKFLAIFVDGCFWHGCNRHGEIPILNRKFWFKKIEGNKKRDRIVNQKIKKEGWRVLRIWEHEIKDRSGTIIAKIKKNLI